jgi:hypothetical protein
MFLALSGSDLARGRAMPKARRADGVHGLARVAPSR